MVIDSVAICGDSFACGSGMPLDRCFEDSFGGKVASELNLPLRMYARSGACNFTIYLQVKKVVEQINTKSIKPVVLISLTNHSRLIFPIDSTKTSNKIDLSNVEYLSYTPYSDTAVPNRRKPDFDLDESPNLRSETISNLNLCLAGSFLLNSKSFKSIMDRKWTAIRYYFEELYDDQIKQEQDIAIAHMMHNLLKEANAPHVIFGFGRHSFRFVDIKNFAEVHWGEISLKYPDRAGSGHCDERGHQIVADRLLGKIRDLV